MKFVEGLVQPHNRFAIATITVRVDDETKERAARVADAFGFNLLR